MSPRFVISGTDTNVGKTVFAAGMMQAIGGDYWKPVQSGLDGPTDTDTVKALTGLPNDRFHPEAYRLAAPLAPFHAALAEGIEIDPGRLVPPETSRPLIIEGAGGLLVPLAPHAGINYVADLFAKWQLPVILVARTELGTINHTLLSIEAARVRGIDIAGVAFIGPSNSDTQAFICIQGRVRELGRMPRLDNLDRTTLAHTFSRCFDLSKLQGLDNMFEPRMEGYQTGYD
jgi:dethiobiotin synthetase